MWVYHAVRVGSDAWVLRDEELSKIAVMIDSSCDVFFFPLVVSEHYVNMLGVPTNMRKPSFHFFGAI